MDYIKDKRTKNLTLRDIHVGDWVQVWSEPLERYVAPLKIIRICDDGTIYLIADDEDRLEPWKENIKDINALSITPELLRGFGFEYSDDCYTLDLGDSAVQAIDNQTGPMDLFYVDRRPEALELDDYGEMHELDDIIYMHELQRALYEEEDFVGTFEPKWKGIKE